MTTAAGSEGRDPIRIALEELVRLEEAHGAQEWHLWRSAWEAARRVLAAPARDVQPVAYRWEYHKEWRFSTVRPEWPTEPLYTHPTVAPSEDAPIVRAAAIDECLCLMDRIGCEWRDAGDMTKFYATNYLAEQLRALASQHAVVPDSDAQQQEAKEREAKDAARYRAIRPFDSPNESEGRYVTFRRDGRKTTFYNGAAMDAAIDAAMSERAEERK